MAIMRWMQYVYIKIIQLQLVNLMVTLWNAHHDYLKGVKLQTYPVEERADGIYIDLQQ